MSLSRLALAVLFCALIAAAPAAPEACTCADARRVNGWCASCETGYVAGIEIESRLLHEALDAHGHGIPRASLHCRRCRENFDAGGFCDDCRLGFVDGMGYFSRLTYHLARGKVVETAQLKCRACAAAAAQRRLPLADEQGWCGACTRGMVGNTAFAEREQFDKARRQLERLLRAVEASHSCERCGVAAFFDGRCPRHGISYRDARPIPPDAGETEAPDAGETEAPEAPEDA